MRLAQEVDDANYLLSKLTRTMEVDNKRTGSKESWTRCSSKYPPCLRSRGIFFLLNRRRDCFVDDLFG